MAQKKYNWDQLHIEWLRGGKPSLDAFLRSKNIPLSGNARKQTAGWVKEREEMGQRVAGVVKEKLEEEMIEVDEAVRRDMLKIYRSLPGLLSRTLRLRGMTKEQKNFEADEVNQVLTRVKSGELPKSAWKELPANIDLFAFEGIVRSARLLLGMPTVIERGDFTHQAQSIADLVEKHGYADTGNTTHQSSSLQNH